MPRIITDSPKKCPKCGRRNHMTYDDGKCLGCGFENVNKELTDRELVILAICCIVFIIAIVIGVFFII